MAAPEILVLNLNRYLAIKDQVIKKIKTKVNIPDTLELERSYFASGYKPTNNITYELFGAVCHDGDKLFSGHYYSYAIGQEGFWQKFSDEKVDKTVFSPSFDQNDKRIHNDAVILFYNKIPHQQ